MPLGAKQFVGKMSAKLSSRRNPIKGQHFDGLFRNKHRFSDLASFSDDRGSIAIRHAYGIMYKRGVVNEASMTMDTKKSLLIALAETLTNESDKGLIDAYAENLNYDDLERIFREQLIEEVSREDET